MAHSIMVKSELMGFELREYTGFSTIAGIDNVHFRYDSTGAPSAAERLHVTVVYKTPSKTVHHYYHSTKKTWRVAAPWPTTATLILGAANLAILYAAALDWGNKEGREADLVQKVEVVQSVPNFTNPDDFPELPKRKT